MRILRAAWSLPLLSAAGVQIAACSHEIESPSVSGSLASPDLVCNAKPVSAAFGTVSIHGESMTPMPSKTLEGTRRLILPKIELRMETPLAGATQLATPLTITDDPADAANSRVHWASEQLMSFDVRPEDHLPTGVMSVLVTNPDGKRSTTIEKGLAIVPAPSIASLAPPAICDDQADQKVVVNGANFLAYDGAQPTVTVGAGASAKTYPATVDPASCAPVTGNFTEKNVELCTSLSFTIKTGDFVVTEKTQVPVVVTNPAPADCASSEAITLTIEPPPEVDAVVPGTVCQGGSQITITGKGFETGATVTLDCAGTKTTSGGVTVSADGKTITATFGGGATPGTTCDVIVQNPDGCQDRPTPHKTVTITTGPILFYADPPVVYDGINTRVTLYATTITPPLPSDAVTMVVNGTATPITTLAYNTVAGHPNRLQAIVPKGQAPGSYDITLKDNSGCFATLPKAITVTSTLSVTMKNAVPPFGWTGEDTAFTMFRDTAAAAPADKPFVATPRMFLNPVSATATDVAVPVESVAFGDGNRVTGVVPKGTPVHGYDVVLVNPDGTVGLLKNGFTETASAPPVITGATPSSIVNATGQKITLTGTGFDAADTVSLSCVTAAGASVGAPPVTKTAPTCAGTACTQSITVDGSGLATGDVCLIKLTNPDGTYSEYSAVGVTGSSLNLNAPHTGPSMNVGRRALSAASGNATPAARFLYALGGDTGASTGALDSYEFAPVDPFGTIGAWTTSPITLSSKRTLSGATTLGRYIYLVGGDDGTGPVSTAERALILSPRETPQIEDVDLALGAAGLGEGEWHYRVSAVFDATDTDNPGGESLASDEFTIRLPAFPAKKIAVTLVWRKPVDALGADVTGVAGYRIYRTTAANDAPGSETLLATVTGGSTVTFLDDGTKTPAAGAAKPLPLGTTGKWASLPALGTKRAGAAIAAGVDPSNPNKLYVYALLGKNGATTAATSYEYLPITVAANGRQSFASAWVAGASQASVGRWQIGAWVVDKLVQSNYAPDTWIFFGGGLTGTGTLNGTVEAGKIAAGGDLGTSSTAPGDFSSNQAGYGVCAANGQLFVFGGANAAPSAGAKSAPLFNNGGPLAPPNLANNAWNNEGISMTHGRYLMGSAVQSAFIFLLGGQTDEPSAASKTTELVIW
jgi:hypothetical protein